MRIYNYDKIKDLIDPQIMIYKEDDHVYFLTEGVGNGSMLFQEKEDCVVLWSDDLHYENKEEMYLKIREEFKTTIIFPYVESFEEMKRLLEIGAKKIEFKDENDEGYCKEFGSFALVYGDSYAL